MMQHFSAGFRQSTPLMHDGIRTEVGELEEGFRPILKNSCTIAEAASMSDNCNYWIQDRHGYIIFASATSARRTTLGNGWLSRPPLFFRTNGQVGRMSHTIKKATFKRFHYESGGSYGRTS